MFRGFLFLMPHRLHGLQRFVETGGACSLSHLTCHCRGADQQAPGEGLGETVWHQPNPNMLLDNRIDEIVAMRSCIDRAGA